jgi:hypothetical protein
VSWQAVEVVLKHSQSREGARLVLLALAYHADARGLNAFPSVHTLADECKLSRRQVQYNLRALEALGEVRCRQGTGRGRVSVYDILIVKGATDFTLSDDKERSTLHPLDEERAQSTTHKGRNLRQERAQYTAPVTVKNSHVVEPSGGHHHKNGGGQPNGGNRQFRGRREQAISEGFKDAFGVSLEQVLGEPDEGARSHDQAGHVHKQLGPRKSA